MSKKPPTGDPTTDWSKKPTHVIAGLAPGGWYFRLQAENGELLSSAATTETEQALRMADEHHAMAKQRFLDHPDETRVFLTTWDGDTGAPYSRAFYERDDVGL